MLLHALWGIGQLGLVTGERRYLDFAKRSWDWMLTQGTGTGWFSAASGLGRQLQRNLP